MVQRTSRTQQSQDVDTASDSAAARNTFYETGEIVITALYDVSDRLVELKFNRCREIPRLLMKIIGLCVPYQPYLSKITIRWSPMSGVALYEVAKFLPQSQVTEIILDDTSVPENHWMLLEHPQLKHLSLDRCKISDTDCIVIANKLVYPLVASKILSILSIASNDITDVGANALGEALRSNRTLQHLNLAGNEITDIGASNILCSLSEFYLTTNELKTKRQRLLEYLKLKKEVYDKCLLELTASSKDKSHDEFSRPNKKKTTSAQSKKSVMSVRGEPSSADTISMRADMMTTELIGSYSDPYSSEETKARGEFVSCVGNMSLCSLNLSFNNLGFATVKNLLNVLQYQETLCQKTGPGLMRVLIEGNNIPVECAEYLLMDELLERAVSKAVKPVRKIERGKPKIK